MVNDSAAVEPPTETPVEAVTALAASVMDYTPTTQSEKVTQDSSEDAGNGLGMTVEDEELTEQDLSEEDEDSLREPSVKRYLPGVSVDLKLKAVYAENHGAKQQVPMMLDFYAECMKTYRDEKLFSLEEHYLGAKSSQVTDVTGRDRKKAPTANAAQANADSKPDKAGSQDDTHSGAEVTTEVSLDDVMWMKTRPNDPLLRCIQSITDRLNIQGIVGDPTSYLKVGGDDMHYDIDDPFIDDDAMFSELRLSKNDILRKKQKERDFSVWSEDEEEAFGSELVAEDFVAQYSSELKIEDDVDSDIPKQQVLFFDPPGWRRYLGRIPKQFHHIFHEFEVKYKGYSGQFTTQTLRCAVTELLNAIFTRLTKIQEPRQRKAQPEGDATNASNKNPIEEQRMEFERRGLKCVGVGKIIGVNGRILRWIAAAIWEVTNAVSRRDMHETWLKLVLDHNERMISEMRDRMHSKWLSKVEPLKARKDVKFFTRLADNMKHVSKSVHTVRRVMRDYEAAFTAASDNFKAVERKSVKNGTSTKKVNSRSDQPPATEAVGTPKNATSRPDDIANLNSLSPTNLLTQETDTVEPKDETPTPRQSNESVNADHGMTDVSPRSTLSDATGKSVSVTRTPSRAIDGGHSPVDGALMSADLVVNTSQASTPPKGLSFEIAQNGKGGELNDGVDVDCCSFANILRRCSLWKRVSSLITLYKYIAADILTWVQMINLALATSISIAATDFSSLVQEEVHGEYVFDKAYGCIADLLTQVVEEVSGTKLIITADVSRVVVMYIHESSTFDDLFEQENKDPIVFYDNSDIAAAPGKVQLVEAKKGSKSGKAPAGKKGNSAKASDKNVKRIRADEGPPDSTPRETAKDSNPQNAAKLAKPRKTVIEFANTVESDAPQTPKNVKSIKKAKCQSSENTPMAHTPSKAGDAGVAVKTEIRP
ncbi:hypothetical protein, conserved [Babesia bigemina]|uniref:Hpc2-related domain-containing protein n=1 Tax=Babesia bigemina TaxID=5866 RepID=A0A061D818_BABBI|nr:hypothetical protein, conserved [Babesia bigemina]CDR93860.1 hypothetical protein, conserved [Babesia bigemina]|eukprot:XP_012766046.1 hypothetical protein, conserved [Babesia bigemina]